MYEGPEFRHLMTFVAVAEECSFTKAAQKLHIAQPAVTAHIKQLEEGLGETMFKRVPSGAELTEPGRKFLPAARQMLHMRKHAVTAASRSQSHIEWPLRLGYSPYVNHDLVIEALQAYKEIVPDGRVAQSSDFTAELVEMMRDGRLDAALVTVPPPLPEFSQFPVCEEKVLVCLRKDHPAAALQHIPKQTVAENLKIMFNRTYHPGLHDYILKRLEKAGLVLSLSETYCVPNEMQFLVKTHGCFGLVREGVALDPELTSCPIEGITIRLTTALICHKEQQRPVLPMLAYRMSQRCGNHRPSTGPKQPDDRLPHPGESRLRRTG